jgi:protein-disulfide isomerase
MPKIFKNLLFIILFIALTSCDQNTQNPNNLNRMVTVKVFSSLTCPHCAEFHLKIYDQLEKDFISVGKVVFEHHAFPLDVAALNAEKILQCKNKNLVDYNFLAEIYKKQNKWTIGSDIKVINQALKNIGKDFGLQEDEMNKCLADKSLEEKILNERIKAQNTYSVRSTPTILINEKKYEKPRDYKSFKKVIEKLL